MKIISRSFHAVLDYMSGVLLIASPWLFNFSDVANARWVAILVGAMILVLSMITRYEGGLLKLISMRMHLNIDMITGLFLAASPWLFNFSGQIYLPHLILGIFELGAGILTDSSSKGESFNHTYNTAH